MGGGLTDDDLIDDSGFDLGIPTPLECWKHQAHQLAYEVGDLQKDLSSARRNIHTLVRMHTEVSKERDAMRLELIELRWKLSDKLRDEGMAAAARINPFENCHGRGNG